MDLETEQKRQGDFWSSKRNLSFWSSEGSREFQRSTCLSGGLRSATLSTNWPTTSSAIDWPTFCSQIIYEVAWNKLLLNPICMWVKEQKNIKSYLLYVNKGHVIFGKEGRQVVQLSLFLGIYVFHVHQKSKVILNRSYAYWFEWILPDSFSWAGTKESVLWKSVALPDLLRVHCFCLYLLKRNLHHFISVMNDPSLESRDENSWRLSCDLLLL